MSTSFIQSISKNNEINELNLPFNEKKIFNMLPIKEEILAHISNCKLDPNSKESDELLQGLLEKLLLSDEDNKLSSQAT